MRLGLHVRCYAQTMRDTVLLLSSKVVTPDDVMRVMGSLQGLDLLARSKLSVYRSVYDLEQLPNSKVPHESTYLGGNCN